MVESFSGSAIIAKWLKESERPEGVHYVEGNPGTDMAATRSLSASLQHLNRLLLADDLAGLSDAELVGRFVTRRDDAAFTALVRRYGPVVLGVCRRVLRHEQDAEDAFQATFLVFARDAAFVKRAGEIGNWLYGVAFNMARKAKTTRCRREIKEHEAAQRKQSDRRSNSIDELRDILDSELSALPDKYRAAIVLCDLRGLTAQEAAAEVGCPPKTLSTRLARGRSLLARRLTRRGFAISTTAWTANSTAAVPIELLAATVHAATCVAGDPAAAVTPAVAALTTGASNAMLFKSLKYSAFALFGLVVLGVLLHLPRGSGVVAATEPSTSEGASSQSAPRSIRDRHRELFHHFFVHVMAQVGLVAGGTEAADDKKEDKPALSGVWVRKEGEMKFEFADKNVLKVSPHGMDDVILILCEYTAEKDGLVKAKITGYEGKPDAREKAKERLPIDSEFSFTWKADGEKATLEGYKSEKLEVFKSLMEGEYGKKK